MQGKYRYGHVRDVRDPRDHRFEVAEPCALPRSVDLRSTGFVPPPLDQRDLGSCTANAASNALRFLLEKERAVVFQPSRLFIYYFSRLLENTVDQDSGCQLRDVVKAIQKHGACSETNWPYDVARFAERPSPASVDAAAQHLAGFRYLAVDQTLTALKSALHAGYPVMMGIQVFESFEAPATVSTGVVPLPDTANEQLLGGHAVLLVGYDDARGTFTFENSWGTAVGQHGFFEIPYAYVTDPTLASDFWTLRFFK